MVRIQKIQKRGIILNSTMDIKIKYSCPFPFWSNAIEA